MDLIAIQFLMSRDRELPTVFQGLNRFGVPVVGMVVAAVVPVLLVLLTRDMAKLADLYAIGVVGAIAANLGSTSTDRNRAGSVGIGQDLWVSCWRCRGSKP